jgi:hypothetical protein
LARKIAGKYHLTFSNSQGGPGSIHQMDSSLLILKIKRCPKPFFVGKTQANLINLFFWERPKQILFG